MEFKHHNVQAIAEMIIGDNNKFEYKSSWYITQFFDSRVPRKSAEDDSC